MRSIISTTLLILSGILFLTGHTSAQTTTLDWAISGGGSSNDRANAVKVDNGGNIFTAGQFGSTVDFDPGVGTYNLSSNGNTDAFVAKYTENANLVWAISFGGQGLDFARKMDIDDSSNIYISGIFTDSVDFDPGVGTHILHSNGSQDAFVVKLDSSGDFQWAKSFGGNGFDYSIGIKYHPAGLVFLTGTYTDSVDFDPDTTVLKKYGSASENLFLSTFDLNGNLYWNKTFPSNTVSSNRARGRDIAIKDNGNILMVGSFYGTVDFDASNNIASHSSNGSEDCFVIEYSINGNYVSSASFGSSNLDNVSSITIDHKKNTYLGGFFSGLTDFDLSPSTLSKNTNGSRDLFISKLDSNMNLLWNVTAGGSSSDIITRLSVDNDGFVYSTGYFYSSFIDMDPSTNNHRIYNNGMGDSYLWQLDSSGNFVSAYTIGGNGEDIGYCMTYAGDDKILTGGSFSSTVDFDPNTSVNNHVSNGNIDFYLKKLSFCKESSDSIRAYGCQFYISPSSKFFNSAGNYLDTIQNAKGCDSVIAIQLTLNQLDTSVSVLDSSLLASTSQTVSYQWLDCNNGFAPIQGETQAEFTTLLSGSYAVEVSQGQCKDTSACHPIVIVGLSNLKSKDDHILFYPNPSKSRFFAHLPMNYLNESFIVYNMIGEKIIAGKVNDPSKFQLNINSNPGVYMIHFYSDSERLSTHKLIVN